MDTAPDQIIFRLHKLRVECSVPKDLALTVPTIRTALTSFSERDTNKFVFKEEMPVTPVKMFFLWKKSPQIDLAQIKPKPLVTDWIHLMNLAVHMGEFDFFAEEQGGQQFPPVALFSLENLQQMPPLAVEFYVSTYLSDIFCCEGNWISESDRNKSKREFGNRVDSWGFFSENDFLDMRKTFEIVCILCGIDLNAAIKPKKISELISTIGFDYVTMKKIKANGGFNDLEWIPSTAPVVIFSDEIVSHLATDELKNPIEPNAWIKRRTMLLEHLDCLTYETKWQRCKKHLRRWNKWAMGNARHLLVDIFYDYVVPQIGGDFYEDWTNFFGMEPVLAKFIWDEMDRAELLRATNLTVKSAGNKKVAVTLRSDYAAMRSYVQKFAPKVIDPEEQRLRQKVQEVYTGEPNDRGFSIYVSRDDTVTAEAALQKYLTERRKRAQRKESIEAVKRAASTLGSETRKRRIQIRMFKK